MFLEVCPTDQQYQNFQNVCLNYTFLMSILDAFLMILTHTNVWELLWERRESRVIIWEKGFYEHKTSMVTMKMAINIHVFGDEC